MMTRTLSPIFGIVICLNLLSTSFAAEKLNADHPNIAIILADDLGYGSLNSYGAVGLRSDRIVLAGTCAYGREFLGIDAPQRVDENVMDELTSDAIRWLQQDDKDVPFFLYFAPVEDVTHRSSVSKSMSANPSSCLFRNRSYNNPCSLFRLYSH